MSSHGDEEWVEIKGYSNYLVSNTGFVYNMKDRRVLTPRDNGFGYMQVALYEEGIGAEFFVHHLVASAFLEGYRRNVTLRWRDEDRSNNAVNNLYTKDTIPRQPRGRSEEYYKGKRVQIVETGEVFLSARACADHIQGDYSSIYKCLRNKQSTHRGYHFRYFEEEKIDA